MSRLLGPLLSLLLVLAAGPALAHASLLSAVPGDGSVVAEAPAALALAFNEPVSPITLSLIGPDGHDVPLTFTMDGPRVTMPTPQGLGHGTYALSWRVISADGHPVGGTTLFSIGAPSAGGAPPSTPIVDGPLPPLIPLPVPAVASRPEAPPSQMQHVGDLTGDSDDAIY